ncbi:Ig-like domain-containing protein [Fontimonas sp. SYSU GA230001]|uniref:Ig-like domain-containing protein n=1 Tax=Fontimonas sp. SYSU GA230001 TaxID=3142450 RepID=UPI0032B470AA
MTRTRLFPVVALAIASLLSGCLADRSGSGASPTPPPNNVPPVAVPDVYTVQTDSTATSLDVIANDIDSAGGGLTLSSVTQVSTVPPGSPGTVEIVDNALSYAPAAGFIGAETLQYTVTDANGATATTIVLITVLPVTAPPIAAPDVFTVAPDATDVELDVLANDIDLTGTGLSLTAVSSVATVPPGSAGTFTIDNDRVIYTPASGFLGVETAQYTVTSGGGQSAIGTIAILVSPLGPGIPPVAIADAATVATDSASAAIAVLANDIDTTSSGLTVTAVERVAALPPTTADSFDTDGTVVNYTPAAGYNGVVTLRYTITDGNGQTSTAPIVITVSPLALPPIAIADVVTVAQDSAPINITALANDLDVSGTGLQITSVAGITTLPPGQTGSFTVAADGQSIIYQPLPGFAGIETLSYGITDGNGATGTGVITITVTPAILTPPPVALPDVGVATSGVAPTPASFNVLANDVDPAGGGLTLTGASITLALPPGAGSVAIVGNQVVYTPAALYTGSVTVTYTAQDALGRTTTGALVITVTAL